MKNAMEKHAAMEALARASFERDSFNGAWLYAEGGEIVSKGAMGFRDPENTLPITEDTIFQLASVTKQFTAAAVMLAVRQGLLSLDDEITACFPDIPYPGVTVRHLLSHTGGVPDYFDDGDWFIHRWKKDGHVPGNDEILDFLRQTKLKAEFAPGEKLSYSNTGYNLLALLVERRSGVPFEEFLQRYIFEPAGMTHTRCCHTRRDGVPFENYAFATVAEDGRYVRDVDSREDGDVTAFDGVNGDDYVYTTVFDMLRWDRVLRSGTVLTLEEQALMYTPAKLNDGKMAVYDDDEGETLGYGFGWAVGTDKLLGPVVSHSGGMPGVHTWLERWLEADRFLVILGSRDEADMRAHMGFYNGLRDIARERDPKPVQTIEELAIPNPDKSRWEGFCGKYQHPEDGDFAVDEVYLRDGELHARAVDEDGDEMDFRLYPIGENEFGRKGGMLDLKFGDGCLMFDEYTCKKLESAEHDQ